MISSKKSAQVDILPSTTQAPETEPFRTCVYQALERYFAQLDGHAPTDLYQMVVDEVESPLLDYVMHHCRGNQSRDAQVVGINRSTLRKKLKRHGLDK